MKTRNLKLELMLPQQIGKDIIFNEAINTIDNLLLKSVTDFSETPPTLINDNLYIITGSEHHNKICYANYDKSNWEFLEPPDTMLVYIILKQAFYIFLNQEWQLLPIANVANNNETSLLKLKEEENSQMPFAPEGYSKFENLKGDLSLNTNKSWQYFYVNDDCKITVSNMRQHLVNVIIKQNADKIYKIEFSENIIWPNKTIPKIGATKNSINYLRFSKLPESNHYLAELVANGFEY